MLRMLKAVAIVAMIATAAVAIVVFGAFIGTLLLFLAGVFLTGVLLYVLWLSVQEHQAP